MPSLSCKQACHCRPVGCFIFMSARCSRSHAALRTGASASTERHSRQSSITIWLALVSKVEPVGGQPQATGYDLLSRRGPVFLLGGGCGDVPTLAGRRSRRPVISRRDEGVDSLTRRSKSAFGGKAEK